METRRRGTTSIPEEILFEILSRLTLRSIMRFKSVCKTWKLGIESTYFRGLFLSLHKNSSSSWSLMFGEEAVGYYGCETWDLPKSLCSYIFPLQLYPTFSFSKYFCQGSSNGLIWINVSASNCDIQKTLVGNPVLQQWVEIPPPPRTSTPAGLVTRVDEDGLVSSFKVVMTCHTGIFIDYEWSVYVYSSETGLWTFERLLSSHCIHYPCFCPSINLNGMIYLYEFGKGTKPDVLIAYDFYSHEEDQCCQVIPLPALPDNIVYQAVRRCFTTSRGDFMYIEILNKRILKVWRLNNNNNSESSGWWQLSHEINMASVGFDVDCIPMTMNPFDSDIVYLWSRQHHCSVSGNLKTQEFTIHQESENWSSSEVCFRFNTSDPMDYYRETSDHNVSQFILPRWMDSIPRPLN